MTYFFFFVYTDSCSVLLVPFNEDLRQIDCENLQFKAQCSDTSNVGSTGTRK